MHNKPLYKYPPLIPTGLQPKDIIGRDMLYIFTEHYKISLESNPDNFEYKMKKAKIFKDIRVKIADIYKALRNNGYYPGGLKSDGSIKWLVVQDSRPNALELQRLDQKEYTKEEIAEMRAECKRKFGIFTGKEMQEDRGTFVEEEYQRIKAELDGRNRDLRN